MKVILGEKMAAFFLLIYSNVHTLLESFLPPAPHLLPGRTCSDFISNFVEEKA
jgi:hypothetical protein